MSKKTYTAHEFADALALAENRAQLKAVEDRIGTHRREVLSNKAFEENARLQAWGKVGRVTGHPDKPETWKCPPGWPAPYHDFNDWLGINLEGWRELSAQGAGLLETSEEKHLRAFREATSK